MQNQALMLVLAGIALLIASAYYGIRYYPPEYGYEEERRNNRKSRILVTASLAPFGLALFFLLH